MVTTQPMPLKSAMEVMMSAQSTLQDTLQTTAQHPDGILDAFLEQMSQRGLELYPAQEQAILEIMGDSKHIILATPTGSGKSLVALALQYRSLVEGHRCFYTCPIKALVSEKFFALCEELGAQNVGMLTGDAAINRDAPVICCTAEILANMSLRQSGEGLPHCVIMDEFHYYADKDRGVAWQLPLLTVKSARFLLMSATLGDTRFIEDSLLENTGRPCVVIKNAVRPVPLDFEYKETPMHETIDGLLASGKAPIYIVNFTQRECAEQAQNILSIDFCSKEEKQRIAAAIGAFRFDTPFGKDVSRLVRHGVGIHHAGLLPKYRLLVEQLAQAGLLKIICGTDTLGVGVNVPIRTVLFTKLSKFDGEQVRILSVRDFQQIAGRAGRKGFDSQGSVVCQAPEHIIENKRMALRVEANAKKKRKLVKKKPPPNFVPWNEETFQKLIHSAPEPLESRFDVSHAMLLNLLQREDGSAGYRALIELVAKSHESASRKKAHRRRAAMLFKSLRAATIISVIHNTQKGSGVVVNEDLQRDFSLNHTLSLYLHETISLLDADGDTYALDILSLVEAILESPKVILQKQIDVLKGELVAELKAQGMDYEDRMEELAKVEHEKPNREFTYDTFNAFVKMHPWVGSDNIRPKSIARQMYEECMTFNEYIKKYALQRSEGVLLRYLSNVYKTLVQNVPQTAKDDDVYEIAAYLRLLLEQVDSSLVTEWEQMLVGATPEQTALSHASKRPVFDPKRDPKAFRARLRNEMHLWVRALSQRDYEQAASLQPSEAPEWTPEKLEAAMAPYYDEYEALIFDHRARLPDKTIINELSGDAYGVYQVLMDPAGDNLWMLHGQVRLTDDVDPAEPMIELLRIGP